MAASAYLMTTESYEQPFVNWTGLSMLKIGITALCCFLFWSIFCRGADPGGNARFYGTEIPAPPASREKWTPPEEPKLLMKVTEMLFGLGMADPRGCDYRQIKVMTGSVWGNYDRGAWNTDGTVIQTHGWVLPTDGKSAQRFAVCWNGWVYPVLAVGDPCSVDEDVQKQLQPLDKKRKMCPSSADCAPWNCGGSARPLL